MFSRALLSTRSTAASMPARCVARRQLSMTATQSIAKLNECFEEYRAKNYTQELPRRFQKDVVKAAAVNSYSTTNSQAVSADGLQVVLQNIGMGSRISRSELECLVSEVGVCPVAGRKEDCYMLPDQMLDLISNNWKHHHSEVSD